MFFSYNGKVATTTYPCHVQSPWNIIVKWRNHNHTITVRYAIVNLYQHVPLTCSQPVPFPCNQHVPELSIYQSETTDTWPVCSATCVCTRTIYIEAHICAWPICYAAYVCLLKTRVFSFWKKMDPLQPLLHQPATCHYFQTVTVPYAYILIHILYPKYLFPSLVMCHISACKHEQV
jgi:hypothetical protein